MPLPDRRGCSTFEERIFKLIATNQVGSPEYNTWKELFGEKKLTAIQEKFKALQKPLPKLEMHTPDEEGWILVHPDEFDLVRAEDILEYGSSLPGGAIYMKIKNLAVQGCQL